MAETSIQDGYLNDLPLWADGQAQLVLWRVCHKYKVTPEVIAELVVLQRERQHQERAHGIYARIKEILGAVE